MSRYIDADSLVKTLYIQSDNDGFICCGVEDLETLIKTQTTADVVERKKAEWREIEMNRVICTECNYICDIAAKFLYSYCPNCGARMGEKRC